MAAYALKRQQLKTVALMLQLAGLAETWRLIPTCIVSAGTVPFRSGERISFSFLISTKFTGDTVSLTPSWFRLHHFSPCPVLPMPCLLRPVCRAAVYCQHAG